MRIKRINIIGALVGGLLAMAGLTACSDSSLDDLHNGTLDHKSYLTLTFVTPSESTPTRSATDDPDGYEEGIEYESTIDFDNDDYKIYFFNSDTHTLIVEFEPEDITSTSGTPSSPATGTESTTTYTVSGAVPDELADMSNFTVVVLANWGEYLEEVTPGTTTIDDLCEANSQGSTVSTFAAMVGSDGVATMTSMPDASGEGEKNLIPFYGVQEYTGVQFSVGTSTKLDTPVSLLRAVAKVEIIVTADSYVHELNTASIVNYNSRGYCAPWQVYTAADYDTSASNNPTSGNWDKEWVDGLHLVGNANETGTKSLLMYKVQDYVAAVTDPSTGEVTTPAVLETWRAYMPEYNNMSTDYSYMTVNCDAAGLDAATEESEVVDYTVYFADYNAQTGLTTAYSEEETEGMPDRLNIKRNNLYRFYVTISPFTFSVYIDILPWVERRDDYEF